MPQTYVLVIESNMILLIRSISIKLKLDVEYQNGWWLCQRQLLCLLWLLLLNVISVSAVYKFRAALNMAFVYHPFLFISHHWTFSWYNNIFIPIKINEHWAFNNFVSIYLNGITAIQPYCLLLFQFLITNIMYAVVVLIVSDS